MEVKVGVLVPVLVGVEVMVGVSVLVGLLVGVLVLVAVAVLLGVGVKVEVQGVPCELVQTVLVKVGVAVFVGGGLLGEEGVLSLWQPAIKMPVPAKIVINSRARNFIMRLL